MSQLGAVALAASCAQCREELEANGLEVRVSKLLSHKGLEQAQLVQQQVRAAAAAKRGNVARVLAAVALGDELSAQEVEHGLVTAGVNHERLAHDPRRGSLAHFFLGQRAAGNGEAVKHLLTEHQVAPQQRYCPDSSAWRSPAAYPPSSPSARTSDTRPMPHELHLLMSFQIG